MKNLKNYNDFIINESFIPVSKIEQGKKYMACDSNNQSDFEEVEVVSIKKDDSNCFDVVIKYNNGEIDNWYLEKDDNVFKQI